MSTSTPNPPCDDTTPHRGRRRMPVRRKYLIRGIVCLALACAGLAAAMRHSHATTPMADPPPRGDPAWAERAADERWFLIGSCSASGLAVLGIVFLGVAFIGRGWRSGDSGAG